MKVELEEWQVKNLREYFGKNDKTQTEHWAYDVFNKALKEQLRVGDVSQQRELFNAILDFSEKLPMCTEDYSRAELWVKYKALNCG